MEIIRTIEEIKKRSLELRHQKRKIGFVPTMGYLHEGHLSLIERAKEESDVVIVSIFVNPIQFNNPEDLEKYPRDEKADTEKLQEKNVDILFMPSVSEVYPYGPPEIFIDYPKISNKLCGKTRPGHFSGVLTVVHNLFQWVRPHMAIFGEKDYQQLLLIRKMTQELHMNVRILSCATVREKDGLAMSSRNARLTPDGRTRALSISKALFSLQKLYGEKSISPAEAEQFLKNKVDCDEIDYAGIYDPQTLEEGCVQSCLAAVAVFIEGVRLIDNVLLEGP